SGNWKVQVKTPKAGGPYKITFDDGSNHIVTITNVLIGEVWFCSGQSNMALPMSGNAKFPVLNSEKILRHASDPELRLFRMHHNLSFVPLNDGEGLWKKSTPQSAAKFSAIGFQFARKLQDKLNVPVGIIEVAW